MKRRFKKTSVLGMAEPALTDAVGKAVVVFGSIEGVVDFFLGFLLRDKSLRKHILKLPIAQRLDVFADLLKEAGNIETADIDEAIQRAKELFTKRNIIVHNHFFSSGSSPVQRISSRSKKRRMELSAKDISTIANSADEVYDDMRQLFFGNTAVLCEKDRKA
jgi:hypothetical protein